MSNPKVRAGMGDIVSETIEVWSDRDQDRAMGLFSLLTPLGNVKNPALVPAIAPEVLRGMYRGMRLIRRLDEQMMALARAGRIGVYTEARGQEAAVIAPAAAIERDDWIVPAHREGGAALYRGLPLQTYVAQAFGNSGDIGKGREIAAHLATPRELKFLPVSSCVATQLPQATGLAWAAKIKRDKTIVLAYLGEGATSAEDFHTGVNFAAVFGAPVVFVCVNNGYALSTPAAEQSATRTFALKALAYGIPGVRVDGNDPLALYAATREAADRARGGGGPTLIEAVTYRLGGHSSDDEPSRYRTDSEVRAALENEPLVRFEAWLRKTGVVTEAAQAIDDALDAEIRQAIEAVADLPPPALRSLIEDVYVTPLQSQESQLAELMRIRRGRASEGPPRTPLETD